MHHGDHLKMTASKVKKYWKLWLKQNVHRFNHNPLLCKVISTGFVYAFKGITKQISLVITFDEYCESMIWFDDAQGNNVDHTVIGYEPLHCSKDELTQKVFEPLIQFTNDSFTCNHQLYLFYCEGYSEAYIERKDSLINEKFTICSILE